MTWTAPNALWLLALVPLYLWHQWPRRLRAPRDRLGYATLAYVADAPMSLRARWANLPIALRAATLALCVIALARPRAALEVREQSVRGRNVVLTLDISSSMKAPDFSSGNRLVAAKRVLADFISQRPGDFLSLVLFASRPFMQAPLTNSRPVLLDLLERADMGMLADGTAIGAALAMSENQLKDLPVGSGVIVLVTDGGNNTGRPDPLMAAAAAKALGIRIYTIGVSSRVPVRLPAYSRPATMEAADPLTDRDETLLRRTAAISGGQYFRAADDTSLARVMGEIDALEKTELRLREVRSYRELFPYFLAPAAALLVVELVLSATWLRRAP